MKKKHDLVWSSLKIFKSTESCVVFFGSGRHGNMGTNIAKKTSPNKHTQVSKKSPTGPAERTPKPEYLLALATYLGVRWYSVPFNF